MGVVVTLSPNPLIKALKPIKGFIKDISNSSVTHKMYLKKLVDPKYI